MTGMLHSYTFFGACGSSIRTRHVGIRNLHHPASIVFESGQMAVK